MALQLRLAAAAMLLLRNGGKFTERQIQNHLNKALRFVCIAALLIAATGYVQLPIVGLIAAAIAFFKFKGHFRRWSNWSASKKGEMAITEALKDLPDEYVLMNDLMLPDDKGNVDHLVMGPNGLFVIETKNYSTFVNCLGDVQSSGETTEQNWISLGY